MAGVPIKPMIFSTDDELGKAAAKEIFVALQNATKNGERFVLGCPGGRSARSTYKALGRMVGAAAQPLGNFYIALMDEYAYQKPNGEFENVDANSHFSCRKFGLEEIGNVLNHDLAPELQLPLSHILVPDAKAPEEFEDLLNKIGIDIFILASGTTDGHVAFNGSGTDRHATTRIASLSDETRTDNLQTFPLFKSLREVPKFGVTVGPETIAKLSKKTIMLLQGSHKRLAFNRITSATDYQADWPATIINECRNPSIFADMTAASSE